MSMDLYKNKLEKFEAKQKSSNNNSSYNKIPSHL